jgi:3-phosphoshikimate 1-carboxyvinyltransferase
MTSSLQEHDIHPALGLLFGLRAGHSFQIDCSLSTPLRDLCAAFGCSITVQRDIGEAEKDPMIRRMRIKARQRLSSQDQLFTVTADFTARAAPGEEIAGPIDILLPGDEVLLALVLAAKSLIPKGSLTIDNAPLEPWATPMTVLMRKMGAKPAQQETHRSAFGPAGIMSLQKFELTGQKTDFVPHFHYAFQLPAMAVLAAFAEGQSLFRKFEDLRRSDPDGIKQLETCLRTMQVKFGDIPDGFVIKGSHEHDGFDLIEPLPAPLAGAFAIAGLHCVGSTTVNEGLLLERWPDFNELLGKFFEYRTSP